MESIALPHPELFEASVVTQDRLGDNSLFTSSNFELLKERLASLPPTPKAAVAPVTATTDSSCSSSQYLQRSSTSETAASCDSPQTDPSSIAEEVENIACSCQTVFRIHQLYIAPGMVISEATQRTWTLVIKGPLQEVLRHEIDKGSCVQEFMMTGKKHDQLRPTVVLTCGTPKVKKQVEKVIKRLEWLKVILRDNKINLVALVDGTRLSAISFVHSGQALGSSAHFWFQSLNATDHFCGRRFEITGGNGGVIGGIILLDDRPYAMTAGHCFTFTDPENKMSLKDRNSINSSDQDDSDDGNDSETNDDDMFWFAGNEDSDALSDHAVSSSPHHSTNPRNSANALASQTNSQSQLLAEPVWNTEAWKETYYTSRSPSHDWALVSLDKTPVFLENLVERQCSQLGQAITNFAMQETFGEVYVVLNGKMHNGYLHISPCTVQVDSLSLNAQLITMERALPLGCSGAWVIANGQLLGHIVAVRQSVPWAYMVPICDTLLHMTRTFNWSRIELPTSKNVETFRTLKITDNIPTSYIASPPSIKAASTTVPNFESQDPSQTEAEDSKGVVLSQKETNPALTSAKDESPSKTEKIGKSQEMSFDKASAPMSDLNRFVLDDDCILPYLTTEFPSVHPSGNNTVYSSGHIIPRRPARLVWSVEPVRPGKTSRTVFTRDMSRIHHLWWTYRRSVITTEYRCHRQHMTSFRYSVLTSRWSRALSTLFPESPDVQYLSPDMSINRRLACLLKGMLMVVWHCIGLSLWCLVFSIPATVHTFLWLCTYPIRAWIIAPHRWALFRREDWQSLRFVLSSLEYSERADIYHDLEWTTRQLLREIREQVREERDLPPSSHGLFRVQPFLTTPAADSVKKDNA